MSQPYELADTESLTFCERIFSKVRGNAQVRIGGKLACFDRERKEVFINDIENEKTAWMPAKFFLRHLSVADLEILSELPGWDGSNQYLLSTTVLNATHSEIQLYRM